MSDSQSPSNAHTQAPLAGTAGIGDIPTPARGDIPVGSQLPSSNPALETHPAPLFTAVGNSDIDVAQLPVTTPHSAANFEMVPRTPLMDATSMGQVSSPRPGTYQHNDSAVSLPAPPGSGRKFMGWMSAISSSLICVIKVFDYCDDDDNLS